MPVANSSGIRRWAGSSTRIRAAAASRSRRPAVAAGAAALLSAAAAAGTILAAQPAHAAVSAARAVTAASGYCTGWHTVRIPGNHTIWGSYTAATAMSRNGKATGECIGTVSEAVRYPRTEAMYWSMRVRSSGVTRDFGYLGNVYGARGRVYRWTWKAGRYVPYNCSGYSVELTAGNHRATSNVYWGCLD